MIKINEEILKSTEINVGDYIKSFDINKEESRYNKVLEQINPIVDKERQILIKIKGSTSNIVTSKNHPMCYFNKGSESWEYKPTIDLLEDDYIKSEGKIYKVQKLFSDYFEDELFIDFEVERDNNYYVSGDKKDFFVIHNTRKGAAVITFPFWHMDVKDLIMLKDAGGSEDKRARGLQYTIKWYNILTKRIKSNEDITLFDPKETPGLNETWGQEFEDLYTMYENKHGVRKQKIPARDLAFLISKVRSETGNLYIVFPDNINLQRIGEEPVFASNLCCEVFLPTKPSRSFNKRLILEFGDDKYYTKTKQETGEIALCNLSSVNLDKWIHMTHEQKTALVNNLLRASDNMISNSYYPVPDGELSNKTRRPIGIGVSNYANFLASNKCMFTAEKAMQLTHEVMEDLTYYILVGSNKLAKERGPYQYFKDSKWAQGIVPMDLYKMKDDPEYNFPLKHDWDSLRQDIKEYGVRFSYHFAIAPTQTSGLIINSTEGIEPTKKIFEMREGTYTLPRIVPNLVQNRSFYQNAFDVGNGIINKLASVRQKFLDQGQSVNHYYKTTDSSYEIINDIIHAEEIGLKSLYYLQPLKAGDVESCESCST